MKLENSSPPTQLMVSVMTQVRTSYTLKTHFAKTHQSYVPFIKVIPPTFVCRSHHPQVRYLHLFSVGVSQDVQVWQRMTATPRAVHVGMQTHLMRGWFGTETLAPNVLRNTEQPSTGKTLKRCVVPRTGQHSNVHGVTTCV